MPAATPATQAETDEFDLDALLDTAKGELAQKKGETKAARGRVRQVARQRRWKKIGKSVSAAAPRTLVYTLAVAGVTAFGIGLVFLAMGNVAASLTLFTVAGAAWGMGTMLRSRP
ncbi:hypothetical protein [Streptomyces sp. NPDC007007]|uniref:hypothetical protein n=1 Tax=Streptomyces sp. NPDC007007 TaxID=3364770 RepID=UPI0036A3A11F